MLGVTDVCTNLLSRGSSSQRCLFLDPIHPFLLVVHFLLDFGLIQAIDDRIFTFLNMY